MKDFKDTWYGRLWIAFWRSLGVGVYEDRRWDRSK